MFSLKGDNRTGIDWDNWTNAVESRLEESNLPLCVKSKKTDSKVSLEFYRVFITLIVRDQ